MNYKDFLNGLVISIACETLPVKKTYPPWEDIVDDEWPLTWKYSDIIKNTQLDYEGVKRIYFVSNLALTASDLENLSGIVKIDGENYNLEFTEAKEYEDYTIKIYTNLEARITFALYSITKELSSNKTGLYCQFIKIPEETDILFEMNMSESAQEV